MDDTVNVIKMKNISKVFFTDDLETRALESVSMTIEVGEFLSLNGPSGCGKSTLLGVMGLLDSPTSGCYFLGERDVAKLKSNERLGVRMREVGFIFQNFNLIGDLTVYENVELPLIYRGMTAKFRRELIDEALDKVGMGHRLNHYPSQLSGGQQQRVAVARALSGKPRILLADEPTGNLDSKNGDAVLGLLKELNETGTTICMVTHDKRYSSYATREIHLFDGKVVS